MQTSTVDHAIARALAPAIDNYVRFHQAKAVEHHEAWKGMRFRKALRLAANGRLPDGSFNDHFQQVNPDALAAFYAALKPRRRDLKGCRSFAEFYRRVDEIGRTVFGINSSGGLSVVVYDTAYAIALAAKGHYEPRELFLHSLPGQAARRLGLVPPGHRGPSIPPENLPHALKDRFSVWQIEDIFCETIKVMERAVGIRPEAAGQPTDKP